MARVCVYLVFAWPSGFLCSLHPSRLRVFGTSVGPPMGCNPGYSPPAYRLSCLFPSVAVGGQRFAGGACRGPPLGNSGLHSGLEFMGGTVVVADLCYGRSVSYLGIASFHDGRLPFFFGPVRAIFARYDEVMLLYSKRIVHRSLLALKNIFDFICTTTVTQVILLSACHYTPNK